MPDTNLSNIDILIIGAGPAGCCAARVAAAAGLSVIAIDKRSVIGEPIQCAEYIPAPLGAYALDTGVKVQAIEDMLSIYNFSVTERDTCRGIMINRASFDKRLADKARSAGADLWMSCYLQSLDSENNKAELRTVKGQATIRYKLLIAADGPKSRVASLLGLEALAFINTRQYSVELQANSRSTKVWLSSRYPGGYAWLFPMGRVANLGVGFETDTRTDLKSRLDALHKQLYVEGIVGKKVLSRTGGPIPIAGLRKPLCRENTLFAGDAAGLTHPISGAGIAAAVTSGEMAGQAASLSLTCADTSAIEDYAQNIQDLYGVSLERALQKRSMLKQYWLQRGTLPNDLLKKSWITSPGYSL